MAVIKIYGNKEPYQLNGKVENIEIRLEGEDLFHSKSKIYVAYDNEIELQFENGSRVYQFAEKLKGANAPNITLTLKEFGFKDEFSNNFLRKTATEVALFKSLFLIYCWVDIAFTDAYAVNLDSKISDEFIIDINYSHNTQNDIYFIKREYITHENMPYIEKLMQLNLLASAFFSGSIGEYHSYFIPLIKPGVSRQLYNHQFDPSGNKTYAFWKNILSDRDWRINSWVKNRF